MMFEVKTAAELDAEGLKIPVTGILGNSRESLDAATAAVREQTGILWGVVVERDNLDPQIPGASSYGVPVCDLPATLDDLVSFFQLVEESLGFHPWPTTGRTADDISPLPQGSSRHWEALYFIASA